MTVRESASVVRAIIVCTPPAIVARVTTADEIASRRLRRPRALDDRRGVGVAGRLPNAPPPKSDGANRLAQNASATKSGANRSSSAPCTRSAIACVTARAALEVSGRRQVVLSRSANASVARIAPQRRRRLGGQRLEAARVLRHRAQDVEAHHVARALPDRVERHLAVESAPSGRPRRSRCRPAPPSPPPPAPGRACRSSTSPPGSGRAAAATAPRRPARRRPARRIASAVAASDSSARSASTLRISGWSARRFPNATRCAA